MNGRGFAVLREAVPFRAVDDARRLLFLAVRAGVTGAEWQEWERETCFFPALRFAPEILRLRDALPAFAKQGQPCEPQILLQFPDPDRCRKIDPTPHLDVAPEWAAGRSYRRIVGVSLTNQSPANGGLVVFHDGEAFSVTTSPGDVVLLDPDAPHSSAGANTTGTVRAVVYFRFLNGRPAR